ncbi:hypothetical protein CALVIDRAFT_561067 [Calocera viscosa TUFC12733]|uniref:Uncharacterized protein n=1 Tax=Calocera viscosa (strain TUFC12733) TaxID=1330018 RepID=A0A167QGL9_CALVF|nr:hypothetical protein CALVIDRAFT_561067 [Calocera viscosa TUFC12733]
MPLPKISSSSTVNDGTGGGTVSDGASEEATPTDSPSTQAREGRMVIFLPVLATPADTSDRTATILFLLFNHLYMKNDHLTLDFLSYFKKIADQMAVIEQVTQAVIEEERDYEKQCKEMCEEPTRPEEAYVKHLPRVQAAIQVCLLH